MLSGLSRRAPDFRRGDPEHRPIDLAFEQRLMGRPALPRSDNRNQRMLLLRRPQAPSARAGKSRPSPTIPQGGFYGLCAWQKGTSKNIGRTG